MMNRSLGLAVVLAFLAGCTSNNTSPGGGGGSSGGSSGGGSSSGSTADDGGVVTAGAISFASGGSGVQAGAYTIVAVFDRGSGHLDGTSPCTAAVGNCQFCGGPDAGKTTPGNLQFSLLSAGTMTFQDGTATLATIPFVGDDAGDGDYEIDSNSTPTLTWADGVTLSASATGGEIPAFSASITAPQDIAGLSPAFSLLTPVTIPTSSALVVSWTPSTDDAQFSLVLGDFSGGTARCTGAESAGSLTVPTAILQQLGTGGGTVTVEKTVSKPVPVTGATVTIQAEAPQVSGSVTFGP
jgi:hypothetical protein